MGKVMVGKNVCSDIKQSKVKLREEWLSRVNCTGEKKY